MAQQSLGLSFIGRAQQLAQLNAHVEKALLGIGQLCFITGEPGAGKTALVSEFTRTAQQQHSNVIVAFGDCNALSGEGDAYLPFREIMTLLLGDVEHGVAEGNITQENAGRLRKFFNLTRDALIESGPDIIGIFVPGGSLLTRLGTKLVQHQTKEPALEQRGSADQSQIFYQFTNVLRRLAQQQPLIIVLDDLHWADSASISLLFHLARRIEGSPILIIGTFRPHEVAEGRGADRHPLGAVLNELKRYYGDIEIDLDAEVEHERREFVDRILDAEPNDFPAEFRTDFFQHTGGHALFTVELINALKERGILRRAGARWTMTRAVDWQQLPGRVEGIVAERLSHLDPDLRELLRNASVEGAQFSAEVLAQVHGIPALDVVRRLGEAHQKHRIVRPYGVRKEGNVRLSVFRFAHNLFQTHLYHEISAAERSYRHAAIGAALEQVYGAQADAAAVVLGNHFGLAHDAAKAAYYLRVAGDVANRTFAHREALGLYARALAFAEELGDTQALGQLYEAMGDVHLLSGRGTDAIAQFEKTATVISDPLTHARLQRKILKAHGDAHRSREASAAYAVANDILNTIAARDESWWREWVQLRLNMAWIYYFHDPAHLQQLITESRDRVEQVGSALQCAAFTHMYVMSDLREYRYQLGDKTLAAALRFLQLSRESGDAYQEALATFQYGFCLLWSQRRVEAQPFLEEGLRLSQRIGAAFPAMLSLTYLTIAARFRNDLVAVADYAQQSETAGREANNPTYIATAYANRGWLSYQQGDDATATDLFEQALVMWEATAVAYPFKWLANAPWAAICLQRRDYAQAAAFLERILAPSEQLLPDNVTTAISRAVASKTAEDLELALAEARQYGLV